jgi:hypothetical protein
MTTRALATAEAWPTRTGWILVALVWAALSVALFGVMTAHASSTASAAATR